MSWNRQYRPKQIQDLHLTQVRDYLQKTMNSSNFPQVFLFTGPKGTGKTSTARILGALLNDDKNEKTVSALFFDHKKPDTKLSEPDSTTDRATRIFAGDSYLVQELDAASNRRIDDVRALKEQVNLAPVDGLVKVYILDEVHMLTTEAFNALLKMLEEPPPHVVFILATTEFDKVPATVQSRCQVIHFTKASKAEIESALAPIVKAEKISIPDDALNLIVSKADGSFRDAVKYLEMASRLDPITIDSVRQMLGSSTDQLVEQLISLILDKDASEIVQFFVSLREKSLTPVSFYEDVLQFLHQRLITDLTTEQDQSFEPERLTPEATKFILNELSDPSLVTPSPIPFLRLELKVLELVDRAKNQNGGSGSRQRLKSKLIADKQASNPPAPSVQKKTNDHPKTQVKTEAPQIKTETIPSNQGLSQIAETLTGNGELLCQEWPHFVKKVAQENFSLATLLKSAQPVAGQKGEVTLSVYYKFHQEQLSQPRFQNTLNQLIADSYGGPLKISCILADQPDAAELAEPQIPDKLEKLAVEALM